VQLRSHSLFPICVETNARQVALLSLPNFIVSGRRKDHLNASSE
jgi:hypothetical protein